MTREQAITELNTFKIGAKSEISENALDMAIKALSSSGKKKMGRWLEDDIYYDFFWRCSKCDKRSDVRWNYCPTCGAKMDKEGL